MRIKVFGLIKIKILFTSHDQNSNIIEIEPDNKSYVFSFYNYRQHMLNNVHRLI